MMIPDHLEMLSAAMMVLQKNLGKGLIATSVHALGDTTGIKTYVLEKAINMNTTNEFLSNLTNDTASALLTSEVSELGDFMLIAHQGNHLHYVVNNNNLRWNTLADISLVGLGKILYYAIPEQITALEQIQAQNTQEYNHES
ncbi:MAG: hypothetical protein RLZZ156_1453 [Deinococcota bacterium]|jgi:hypothetical protein